MSEQAAWEVSKEPGESLEAGGDAYDYALYGGDAADRREALEAVAADPVRAYLKVIGRVALLTAEEEVELAKRIETGVFARQLLAAADPDIPDAERAANRDLMARQLAYGPAPEKGEEWRAWQEQPLGDGQLAEVEALLERQADTPEQRRALGVIAVDGAAAKNRLMEANLRLVVSVANRYRGQGLDFLDLVQDGNIGLNRAVEKFDYARGIKFSTYAIWWIRQSIARGVRDTGRTIRLPVNVVDDLIGLQKMRRAAFDQTGRYPTVEELAGQSGLPADRVRELLDASRRPYSLDERLESTSLGHPGEPTPLVDRLEDQNARKPDEAAEESARHDSLRVLLSELGERERMVLEMRAGFYGGRVMTLEEIGSAFKICRERVRQIETKAKKKLRADPRAGQLKDYDE